MAASALLWRSAGAMRSASSPISTFSSTVSQGNSAKDWNTIATSGAGPATRRPAILTSPPLAGMRPAMMRSRVVLPLPERPSSETISLPARDEVDVVEHEHIVAAALGIVLADTVDLEQRRRSDSDSRQFHDGLLYSRRKRRSASR